MMQEDISTGYVAFHLGVGTAPNPYWEGSWGDVTHDTVGQFAMSPT
jgi:hypothetical protein